MTTNLFGNSSNRAFQEGDKVYYQNAREKCIGFIFEIAEDEDMPYKVGDNDSDNSIWVDKVELITPVKARIRGIPLGTAVWAKEFEASEASEAKKCYLKHFDEHDICLPYFVEEIKSKYSYWTDDVTLVETFIPPIPPSIPVPPPPPPPPMPAGLWDTGEAINTGTLTQNNSLVSPPLPWAKADETNTIRLKESHMTKINNVVARTKASAVSVATIQAGKAANMAVIKAVRPHMPMMVRGYMDHPLAPAIIAMGLAAASEYLPAGANKQKLVKLTDCMMTAAIADGADKYLNIEAFMDTIFSGMPAEVRSMLDEESYED